MPDDKALPAIADEGDELVRTRTEIEGEDYVKEKSQHSEMMMQLMEGSMVIDAIYFSRTRGALISAFPFFRPDSDGHQ